MISHLLMIGGLLLGGWALAASVPYVEALWTRRKATRASARHGGRRVCRTRKPPHRRSPP